MVEEENPSVAPDLEAADGDASDIPSTSAQPAQASKWQNIAADLMAESGRDKFAFLLAMSVGAAILFPYLGSVGYFDPWETNYAEVARQMVVRDDYLYPFWKEAYFFSKPILLFWLSAPLYALTGVGADERALSDAAEWCGRLPVALFSLLLLGVAFQISRRLWNTRAALLGTIAMATTPYFGFTSRQAIPDTLYVAPMSAAMLICAWLCLADDEKRKELASAKIPMWFICVLGACLLPQAWEIGRTGAFLNRITLLGSEYATRIGASVCLCSAVILILLGLKKFGRDPFLLLASTLLALATLGKGPHAVVFVLIVFFFYFVVSGEWDRLLRPTLILAAGVYLLVAAPWVIVMLLFEGLDDGRKTWFRRFVLHDLFGRLGGVHGERGGHEYYIRYLSFGLFQWAPAAALSLFSAISRGLPAKKTRTPSERFTLLVSIWIVTLFVFFSVMGTKFHHYIYPVALPAALLIGWWLDDVLTKRTEIRGMILISLLVLVMIVRDLCVEPWQWADLFSYHYVSYKPSYYFPKETFFSLGKAKVTVWQLLIGIFGALAVLGPLLGAVADARRKKDSHRKTFWGTLLGTQNSPSSGFVFMTVVTAVVVGLLTVHVYWSQVSQHWTHRHILDTYWEMSEPGEPLIAYQMDWKGETFYAHNTEREIKKSQSDLRKALKEPGRAFVIVQQDRYERLKKAVGKKGEAQMSIVDKSNTKWYLVTIDDTEATAAAPMKSPAEVPGKLNAPVAKELEAEKSQAQQK